MRRGLELAPPLLDLARAGKAPGAILTGCQRRRSDNGYSQRLPQRAADESISGTVLVFSGAQAVASPAVHSAGDMGTREVRELPARTGAMRPEHFQGLSASSKSRIAISPCPRVAPARTAAATRAISASSWRVVPSFLAARECTSMQ